MANGLQGACASGSGPPRAIADGSGSTIWSWQFQGNTWGEQAPASNGYTYNRRFSGQYFDAETGLHYNGQRDYDPATGRYGQVDPIGLNGGQWSLYAYVGGNPLNYIDRLGLAACPPNVKKFFQALGPTINQMSEDMNIDPDYLLALSAFESGWWGSHAQSLNNPFGLTQGGGNDLSFSSVSSAGDFFENNIGPSIVDAGSMEEFTQDLRGEGYNSTNPDYDQNLNNVYKSVQKYKKNCDCTDQSEKKKPE